MNKIHEIICILLFAAVFSIFIIWVIPDKAYLLISSYIAMAVALLVNRKTGFEEKTDERMVHLFRLGAANSWLFMFFALPTIALFIQIGLLVIDTVLLLFILLFSIIAISWLTVGYNYMK